MALTTALSGARLEDRWSISTLTAPWMWLVCHHYRFTCLRAPLVLLAQFRWLGSARLASMASGRILCVLGKVNYIPQLSAAALLKSKVS